MKQVARLSVLAVLLAWLPDVHGGQLRLPSVESRQASPRNSVAHGGPWSLSNFWRRPFGTLVGCSCVTGSCQCCPDTYCPKPPPLIPAPPCCACPDCYLPKPLPVVPCPEPCCCPDTYCPKPWPPCPRACEPWYRCGPAECCGGY